MPVIIDTPIRPNRSSYGYGRSGSDQEAQIASESNQEFLTEVLGRPKRFHYSSRDKLYVATLPSPYGDGDTAQYKVATVSLGIQAIHRAFAAHVPLSLTPDLLWYMIVHEVAEHVRQNSSRYAKLFTDAPGEKQKIEVRDDSLLYDGPSDWMGSINLVREPLAAKVTDYTMGLFLPKFSTSTIEDETSILVAFMDVVSPFYEFQWTTRCGIPQIRLEGEPTDWQLLRTRTERLASEFDGLAGYFKDLLPVLETIAQTAAGVNTDEEFWRSIYKYDNGSGGPYVTGWITAFFAHVQTPQGAELKDRFEWRKLMDGWGGFQTNDFPSHVSRVPFVWDYYGKLYDMAFAAGVTGVDYDGTFLAPKLGFAVVEV